MSVLNPEKAFLGSGLAYPVGLQADGALAMALYEKDVHQAIRIILGTNPGERLMRPDFGAGLNAFVFEPLNTTTLVLVEERVRRALVDWEPRINLESVDVTADSSTRNRLLIEVHYQIRATNSHHNLVYPFYLEEGTAT